MMATSLCSATNYPLWFTGTNNHWDAIFALSPSREIAICDTDSTILWTSNTYQLPYNYPGQAPMGGRFADGSAHSHITTESNAADRADWQWRVDGPGAENEYEPTDLAIYKLSAWEDWVDVYWYQDDTMGYFAVTECMAPLANNECDRFRVRFSDELASWYSHMKNNAVCHECGHTVGFGDGGVAGASCIVGGATSRISALEHNQINARY